MIRETVEGNEIPKKKQLHLCGGASLVVQWLELCTFTTRERVQSQVGETRSCKQGEGKKEKICSMKFLHEMITLLFR